jgi:hypothetical protein
MKKCMAAMLAAAAAVMLASCGTPDNEPVSAPEDGWTGEKLSKRFCISGEAVGFPCKLDELKKEFEIEDGSDEIEEGYYFLNTGGKSIGTVCDSDGNGKTEVLHLLATDDIKTAPISINGVTLGSTQDKAEELLGGIFMRRDDGFIITVKADDLIVSVSGNDKDGVKMMDIRTKE